MLNSRSHLLIKTIKKLQSKDCRRNYYVENVFGFKEKSKSSYEVPESVQHCRQQESNFFRLVTAYRTHAHKYADVNPVALNKCPSFQPELAIERYSLTPSDVVTFTDIINAKKGFGSVAEAVFFLNQAYKQHLSVEFMHLEEEEVIEWFSRETENLVFQNLNEADKIHIVTELLRSQAFDNFLAKKFATVKRYGGEGAESMMAFFSEFFQMSVLDNLEQIVIAMPHRGRLNFLTGMLNFPPVKLFSKLKGRSDFPSKYQVTGDVVSHFISSTDLDFGGKPLHVTLLYNPSHLEAVNPVSMGKTRGKQLKYADGDYGGLRWSDKILNVQVHGDAAIAGQGVNQECLALCSAPNFNVGGTIHLVVNNQLGFTTPADIGKSSRYCTDIAKIISAPVIHVNGDNPEAVLKAARLAFAYQRRYRKDVFVDMNCYRQWGHNELDDPSFTNPALYNIIKSKGTVPDEYARKLENEGILKPTQREQIVKKHTFWLNENLNSAESYEPEDVYFRGNWEGFSQAQENVTVWDTGINFDLLTFLGCASVKYPQNFSIHPHLLKNHVKKRLDKVAEGINIDWATAEAMAFGSLLFEGYNVRLSGQDVGRGTFSHRHVMLVDQETNKIHIPLNNMHENQQSFLEVANSVLSEEAVLGFEYGFSIESPRNLVIWEAQFGDFFNGAQVIFDTFITSGEAKWLWSSGLVVLLPHGYDGAGPEHSSARIERFLQLTDSKEGRVDGDNINMQVCQPTTPAQYFHLIRRQMVRNFRKPLIIISPKTLLRSAAAVSDLSEMSPGTHFKTIIGESMYDAVKIKKVLITSGRHYYTLFEKRQSLNLRDTAIIAIEQFCPFPAMELIQEISKFTAAKMFVWCQEEPQNMGAWSFVKTRFENLVGKKLLYCGRPTQAAPAVGSGQLHAKQASYIVTKPFLIDIDSK